MATNSHNNQTEILIPDQKTSKIPFTIYIEHQNIFHTGCVNRIALPHYIAT